LPRFTNWRKVADRDAWYDDEFDYDGPACYELGTGHSRTNVTVRYVGETVSESARIRQYAQNGSHISHFIDSYLRRGYNLYYRGMAMSSKKVARELQDMLLAEYDYDWNTVGQSEEE
jgi:GIY-YIG domain-containing protein